MTPVIISIKYSILIKFCCFNYHLFVHYHFGRFDLRRHMNIGKQKIINNVLLFAIEDSDIYNILVANEDKHIIKT